MEVFHGGFLRFFLTDVLFEIRGSDYGMFRDGRWDDIDIVVHQRKYIDVVNRIGVQYERISGKKCTIRINY